MVCCFSCLERCWSVCSISVACRALVESRLRKKQSQSCDASIVSLEECIIPHYSVKYVSCFMHDLVTLRPCNSVLRMLYICLQWPSGL